MPLKSFASYHKDHELKSYMTDPMASRYTFEKCIFEAYMAFRGVGGKKPFIKCAMSLGLNLPLSAAPFCRSEDYETKKESVKKGFY